MASAVQRGTQVITTLQTDDSSNLYVKTVSGSTGAVTIADGADVAEGATTDAAVYTDTTGTLSGKMRGLVKLLASCISIGSNWMQVSVQNATLAVVNTPATAGGFTTYHLVSAASTNATVVKASPGQVFGWYIYNSAASARKVAFHNTTSTPTAGASVFFSLMLPAGAAANVMTETGIPFSTGIGITTVTGIPDSDNTAVSANDLIINLFYK